MVYNNKRYPGSTAVISFEPVSGHVRTKTLPVSNSRFSRMSYYAGWAGLPEYGRAPCVDPDIQERVWGDISRATTSKASDTISPTTTPFVDLIGKTSVTIEVGPTKEAFLVHKDVLCKKAPVFDSMFNGKFQESHSQKGHLAEDDVEAFKLFIAWIYLGVIETPNTACFTKWASLFAFAHKYCITELADATMDKICAFMSAKSALPAPNEITAVYGLTPPTSKLNLFIVRCFAYMAAPFGETKLRTKFWPTSELRDLAMTNEDLTLQFFELLRMQGGKAFQDPRIAPRCEYHEHGADKACPCAKSQNSNARYVDSLNNGRGPRRRKECSPQYNSYYFE